MPIQNGGIVLNQFTLILKKAPIIKSEPNFLTYTLLGRVSFLLHIHFNLHTFWNIVLGFKNEDSKLIF